MSTRLDEPRVIKKIKRAIKSVAGLEYRPKPDTQVPTERFGSDYGGWALVVEGINQDSVIYSFGVGEDASFDIALIERFGLTVHAFDPTPKSIEWASSQNLPNRFVLHEYGIADKDGTIAFNPPEDPEHVSHTVLERPETEASAITVPVKKLQTIMQELGHSAIDVLKMDVEGAEYAVIEAMVQTDLRPRQILVEFHHRFPNVGVEMTKQTIEQLRDMGYQLITVSDSAEEFGFLYSRAGS